MKSATSQNSSNPELKLAGRGQDKEMREKFKQEPERKVNPAAFVCEDQNSARVNQQSLMWTELCKPGTHSPI